MLGNIDENRGIDWDLLATFGAQVENEAKRVLETHLPPEIFGKIKEPLAEHFDPCNTSFIRLHDEWSPKNYKWKGETYHLWFSFMNKNLILHISSGERTADFHFSKGDVSPRHNQVDISFAELLSVIA